VILAYAGRRAKSLGGDPDALTTRIRRLLAGLQPAAIVGAAADGGDLLVLRAALAMPDGPAVRVILPTTRAVFCEDSVDPEWRGAFDVVLETIEQRGGRVDTLDLEPGEAAYRRANQRILDCATSLAHDGQRAVALLVAREGEGAMIDDLVARADIAGVPTLRIDPSVDVNSQPKCFVAMPFGKKPDPQRAIEVDCDRVYGKVLVPALEHAQLDYRRGDEEIDSGIVLEPMIEWLASADIVIGDFETGNFNVGWELGLRHIMREARTLLIGPRGTTAPFDVSALRHVRYDHDEHGVSDDAAIAAWRALGPHLAADDDRSGTDSPVAAVMQIVQWGIVRRRAARDQHWEALRLQLSLARDLGDAGLMLTVLEDAPASPEAQRRLLRAEAGVGLVRLGHFAEARQLLREIVEDDPEVERPDAHAYYAQSLYRVPGATAAELSEAERVLKRVLIKRPGHPEVRALLGAVAKRRLLQSHQHGARRSLLRLAIDCYRHDFERNLNLYYEGVNVVALGVALERGFGDAAAGAQARALLPAVRVAAGLTADRPDESFWAAATLAECTLHEHLLGLVDEPGAIRGGYRAAGALRPPRGDLASTLAQLDFLRGIGLPEAPLADARAGLLEGADREFAS
jgi:hypothetical protein